MRGQVVDFDGEGMVVAKNEWLGKRYMGKLMKTINQSKNFKEKYFVQVL